MAQTQRLRGGTLDVGFVRPPIGDDTIATRTIRIEPLCAELPAEHPLAGEQHVELAQLAGDPFVLPPRRVGPGFYDQVVALCRAAGFNPWVVQEAAEMHTIVSLVAAGIGVSLVPSSVRSLRRDSVAYVALAEAPPPVEMALAYRRGDDSPVLQAFLEVVSETTSPDARE